MYTGLPLIPASTPACSRPSPVSRADDQIVLREHVVQHTEHLGAEALGLRTTHDRIPGAHHANADLRETHQLGCRRRACLRSRRRSQRRAASHDGERKGPEKWSEKMGRSAHGAQRKDARSFMLAGAARGAQRGHIELVACVSRLNRPAAPSPCLPSASGRRWR